MTVVGTRRRAALALSALVIAWIAVPAAVPLYDGINFPDEPYRYVVPPAGYQKTPQPLSAKGSSPVADSTNTATIYANTDEQAPQVNVVIPNRLLAAPAGARTVTVSVVPVAPDRQPAKGSIDGNLYRVSATADPAGPVAFAPPQGDLATVSDVTMRATTARKPGPSFLYRPQPAQSWRVLKTFTSGNDVYSTQFAGFGDYALAFGVVASAQHSGDGLQILLSVLLVLVLAAAAIVVGVRVSRRPARE
ncbi:MAG: hypothetical protein QOF82_1827 [Frankiales bacterium]|nr:hypothetical protein [Frankiales bacterium]